MDLRPTQTGHAEEPKGSSMKFTYPSGSRPLDGFTIKRGVGRGGFGEVYFGTSDGGKEVALKLIRRNLEVELRGVTQCLNLKHPNLLSLYDIRTDESDDRWVVMEYVAGESLEDAIERNPNGMPIDQVLRWIHGIAAGVAHLHDHGIVHRDLKPGNIFCDEGTVKVGDYGLAKFISCSRRSGQTESVGTVHYMAPEIANGRYGREIDTYALGIILYEMLTGRVPFEGESVGEVLMKHLTAEPDLSLLDPPYRDIVQRALTKDPKSRINSVAELVAQLPPPPDGGVLPPVAPTPPADPAPVASAAPPADAAPAASEYRAAAAAPQNVQEDVVAAEAIDDPTDDEPILAAIRSGWRSLEVAWADLKLPPAMKTLLLVGIIFGLVFSAGAWSPPLIGALICYGVYRVVRAIFAKPKRRRRADPRPATRPTAVAQPASDNRPPHQATQPRHRRVRRMARRDRYTQPAIEPKSVRTKMTELTGSMLLGTAIAVTMSVVMMLLGGRAMDVNQFVWMSLVSASGTWAVMISAKLWEGTHVDRTLRRFGMLVVGLAVGASASVLTDALFVQLPHNHSMGEHFHQVASGDFYRPSGAPTLFAYMAYFAFLFLVPRWWRQADPQRASRLSLWATGACVFWAWLLSQFWHFPQPWGLMLAAVVSVSVQLASPWEARSRRGAEWLEA